jgi:hypothetical protein
VVVLPRFLCAAVVNSNGVPLREEKRSNRWTTLDHARTGGVHGGGTAVDLVPAEVTTQARWHASAGRLARDLGWTPACGSSGSRPACTLVPAIQFIGYDGYPARRQSAHMQRALPGPRPRLLGVAVLRLGRPLAAVRLGHGIPATDNHGIALERRPRRTAAFTCSDSELRAS